MRHAKYDPKEIVCRSHCVHFVRFEARWADAVILSHGCPVCVGLIRAKVKFEMLRGPTRNLRSAQRVQRARRIAPTNAKRIRPRDEAGEHRS